MKVIALVLGLSIIGGSTIAGVYASFSGLGLPGLLDKPVSIRQSSATKDRRRGGGLAFFYWSTRRHYGGGYRGGK